MTGDTARAAALAVREVVLDNTPPPVGVVVGGYWPLQDEIDPLPLLQALAARGHPLSLPVTPPRDAPPRLTFHLWDGTPAKLVDGPFKTRQPPPSAPRVTPDWLLVPLVGFDRAGTRLGYGGGYYDRLLDPLGPASGRPAVGLAFACQEIGSDDGPLPKEPHDIPLTAIATEQGLIRPPSP